MIFLKLNGKNPPPGDNLNFCLQNSLSFSVHLRSVKCVPVLLETSCAFNGIGVAVTLAVVTVEVIDNLEMMDR